MGELVVGDIGYVNVPGTGLSFVTLQNRTYDGFRDPQREFIVLDEVKSWINEAQRDLAHRTQVLTKETDALVTDADGRIALPADFIDGKGLRLGEGDDRVTPVEDDKWFDVKESFVSDPYGGPFYRVFANYIEIVPTPPEGTVTKLRYVYEPVDLVADGDISPLPRVQHMRMVWYAQAMGFIRLNEMQTAQARMEQYEQGLPEPTLGQRRTNPGPITVAYEPGPMDLYSSHRG